MFNLYRASSISTQRHIQLWSHMVKRLDFSFQWVKNGCSQSVQEKGLGHSESPVVVKDNVWYRDMNILMICGVEQTMCSCVDVWFLWPLSIAAPAVILTTGIWFSDSAMNYEYLLKCSLKSMPLKTHSDIF